MAESLASLSLGTPVAAGVADWRTMGKEAARGMCNESCQIHTGATSYYSIHLLCRSLSGRRKDLAVVECFSSSTSALI